MYDTDPAKFRTLQNILEVEKGMYGAEWPKVGATLALLWLKRWVMASGWGVAGPRWARGANTAI